MANVFNSNFDPVLYPGETAHLVTAQKIIDVECVAVGALPEYTKDFGALAAATWNTDNEDSNLEMNSYELSQLRMRVISDVNLRLNNLSPTRQWRTSKADFVLGQFPQDSEEHFLKEYLFKASELFVYEDDTPRFDFYSLNVTAECLVKFSGWRFKVRQIPSRGKVTLWVSGWPSGAAA